MEADREKPSRLKQKLVVNKEVQYAIISYSLLFAWIMYALSFVSAFVIFQYQATSESPLPNFVLFIIMLVFLGLGAVFGIFLTHRIAGPIHHLHQHMLAAAKGEAVAPITFRKKDFFRELADPYNIILGHRKPAEGAQSTD